MPDPVPPPPVTLLSPEGKATDVPADQVQAYTDRGFTQQDVTGRAQQVATDTIAAHTSTAKSVAYGVARGATFGLSDALLNPTEKIDAQDAQAAHPIASLGGNLAGALLTGGATLGRLGSATGDALGGGVLARAAGGVVEGAGFGAGNAVSELALSDDPLTAEHIAGSLSSNMLLGAGIGAAAGTASKLLERGLGRASEAIDSYKAAADSAQNLPADLAGLDDKALLAARKTEVASLQSGAVEERGSLEQLRVNQRQEVVNQVKDLADDLGKGGDRPIYHALVGDDVRALPGMGDAASQLNKSFRSIRAITDNPLSAAENPNQFIKPLQMRQAALEGVQGRMPELQATLAGDSRAAVLEHVDDALAQTKQQIEQIRALDSKVNPVTSARLTELSTSESARTQAIDAELAARKTAAAAPDSIQKQMLGGSVYSGVAGLMHALPIPGTSLAAPVVAAKVAKFVTGKMFGTAARVAGESVERSSSAVRAVLGTAPRLITAAPVLATKILSSVRFAADAADAEGRGLPELYKARAAELRSQTAYDPTGNVVMRPEARAAMAQRLAPIRTVNPILADQLETIGARKVEFLSSKLLRKPDAFSSQVGPDRWQPSDMEMRQWARYVNAVENPSAVEERVAAGTVTPEDAEAYHAVYPERASDFKRQVNAQLPTLQKSLPYAKRVALSIFSGVPVDPAMRPNILAVLQGNFAAEPGSDGGTQAPKPQPQFGSIKKSIETATPAQQRGQGAS